MSQHNPRMFLPRPDGTRDVYCENSSRRRKPCYNYVTFSEDNVLISGHVVYSNTGATPRYVCSWTCIESVAKAMRAFEARYKGPTT
jgi:hypothetical protein